MPRVEDKKVIFKKGFALLVTMIFVVLLSFFSYTIIQSNIFASNLNQLKYLHFQANLHLDFIKEYITSHTKEQIESFTLDDQRFILSILSKEENEQIEYYIYLQSSDDTPIRLSDKIIK